MNEITVNPTKDIVNSEEDLQWNCIFLKVTENLTLTIGVRGDTIRIRSGKTIPIEAKMGLCPHSRYVPVVEIFPDLNI